MVYQLVLQIVSKRVTKNYLKTKKSDYEEACSACRKLRAPILTGKADPRNHRSF